MSSYRPSSMDDIESFIDFTGGIDHSSFPEDHQTFSGPSHEYDRFRQQTGLPPGAVSNVAAYNDMAVDNDFLSQSDLSQSADPSEIGHNSRLSFDMDFESTPRAPAMFYPPSSFDDFSGPSSSTYEAPPPVRMWPGVHSQQAEQAKAAAAAKQQRQQLQGQQMMQQRLRQSSQSQSVSAGKNRQLSQTPLDAAVTDRRISEILDGMRHKSGQSPVDEDDEDGDLRGARKTEEEMDEDERLLASEEGKKLTSKERRQLRNKVSARAFRSRRKEYISQLEGDLAAKANETTDLKLLNRKLLDENNQLKNLTRTLLSHPSFQTFLEDMSRNQTFLRGPAPTNFPGAPMEVLPSNANTADVKQESELQQQPTGQGTERVNMAHMPETSLDFSTLNLGNSHWNFQQPQVFSVFDLPERSSVEEIKSPRLFSEKESSRDLVAQAVRASQPEREFVAKDMPAALECPCTALPKLQPAPLSSPISTASADLYDDTPSHPAAAVRTLPRKASPQLRVALRTETPDAAITTINQLFDDLERQYRRIDDLTSHLPRG